MKNRKEVPVKNNPGIYKEIQCEDDGGTGWKPGGTAP